MKRVFLEKKPKRKFGEGYKTYDTAEGFGSSYEWKHSFKDRLGIDEARKVVDSDSPQGILGVSDQSTWAEIKKAYRTKAMKNHPDKGGSAEAFRKIQGAYEVLEYIHKKK